MSANRLAHRRSAAGCRALAVAISLTLGLSSAPAVAGPPRGGGPKGVTLTPAPVGPGSPGGPELSGDERNKLPHNTCRKQPRNSKFTITLPKEAELEDLINWMMTISCQKFIVDPKVRSGKITILSPEPITVDEAYGAFYASLEQMGLTVEPSGEYFKIVESGGGPKNLPVYGPGSRAPNNDRYVTQLYRAADGNVSEISGVLNKLKTKQGTVETVGDLIIVTDTGSSIRRLMKIVKQVDASQMTGEKIFFYQLRYADAGEVAEIVREIFGENAAKAKKKPAKKGKKGAAAEPSFSRVIVDERTGTLIIVAAEGDYVVIRRLIEQLDVPLAGTGSDRIHVVKLRNADPQEVAQVLQQLASGAQSNQQRGGNQRAGSQRGQPAAPAGGATAVLFSGDIKVTADPATRSLVILASQSDFYSLQPVIEKLDAERKQVYIEVYLLELTISRKLEGGAAAHFGSNFDTGQGQGLGFVASAPTPALNSVLPGPGLLSGIVGGVLGPEVPGSGQFLGLGRDIPAFGVVIQALHRNNDVNVVAEPHMFTADNQEATIEVGRNVPTPGGLAFPGGGQGGGLVPVQSIQRENVTLKVTMTPHVNDEKTVTLDVELEDRDIESIDQVLGVTTSERRLKLDQVVAKDDQPLVLGGLVRETERETVAQVPGLGSIPLLGWLFKRKRKERVRSNLLMILVPHIIDSPDEVRRIHARRAQERLDFMQQQTSFKKRELATNVNYRNKKGLLSEINLEARRMNDEVIRYEQMRNELEQQTITGELGMAPAKASDANVGGNQPAAKGGAKPKPKPRKGSVQVGKPTSTGAPRKK